MLVFTIIPDVIIFIFCLNQKKCMRSFLQQNDVPKHLSLQFGYFNMSVFEELLAQKMWVFIYIITVTQVYVHDLYAIL